MKPVFCFGRSRRLSFGTGGSAPMTYTTAGATQYTPRQLNYIAQLFREMLRVRQLTIQVRFVRFPQISSQGVSKDEYINARK